MITQEVAAQPAVAGRAVARAQDPGAAEDARALNLWLVCGLALIVGCVTGLGAVMFRALIGFVHNLLFLGPLVRL